MKKVNLIIISLTLFILAACNGDAESSNNSSDTIEFLVAAPSPGSASDVAADEIISNIEELSDGKIQGQKISAESYGGERELAEGIQMNDIDMALISDMGIDSQIDSLGFAWLPYMFTDYETADEYYLNGWLGEEINRIMAENSLNVIGKTELGFRVMSTNDQPINTPEDFNGIKIRVPDIPQLLDFHEILGSLPTFIDSFEILPALQQNTIDGIDNTIFAHDTLELIEPQEHFLLTNHMYAMGSIVVSDQFWDSLSEEEQELLLDVGADATDKHIETSRENDEKVMQEAIDNGWIEVHEPSEELDAYLQEAALQVWENYSDNFDEEIMDRIMEDFR